MLNSTFCASNLSLAIDDYINSYPHGDFAAEFVNNYVDYVNQGVLSSGGAISGSEDPSILLNFFNSFDSSTNDNDFGVALATFWSTCMLVPSAGSVSVSNNASSKVAAFTAAINNSYTTSESTPYYKHVIDNIEAVAKTIIWTCIKPTPLPPTLETIS